MRDRNFFDVPGFRCAGTQMTCDSQASSRAAHTRGQGHTAFAGDDGNAGWIFIIGMAFEW
jgi:hypothetical protein